MNGVVGFVAFLVFVFGRKWRDEDQLCPGCRQYFHKCRCYTSSWEA